MLNREKHIVPTLENHERLSDYAVGIFSSIPSRKGIKKAIKKEWITIDGKVGRSGDYLNGGEELFLTITEIIKPVLEISLEVLFEDDHLAIIDKPAGITVSGNKAHTIENTLPYNLKKSNQPDALNRPEPIHRLDHPTSGVLLIGKTRSATIALNQLFEKRTIQKVYYAVTLGLMEDSGIIDFFIDNKPSKTFYSVIATLPSERFDRLNLVECHPHTGRRHQIRKHFASLGHAILGDQLYSQEGLLLKGKGLYLHASSLEFIHPLTGETIIIESELPKKFRRLFRSLA